MIIIKIIILSLIQITHTDDFPLALTGTRLVIIIKRPTFKEGDTQTVPLLLGINLASRPVLTSDSATVCPLTVAPFVPGGTVTGEVSG